MFSMKVIINIFHSPHPPDWLDVTKIISVLMSDTSRVLGGSWLCFGQYGLCLQALCQVDLCDTFPDLQFSLHSTRYRVDLDGELCLPWTETGWGLH